MSLASPGDKAYVQGSGAKPYELKNVDNVVFTCTCPAWRNAGGGVMRTCKHLKKERGDAAEAARVGGQAAPQAAAAPAQAHGLTGGKAVTADPAYAQTILDRAAADGRKLRQDEKAKLHGPGVMLAHPWDGDVDPTGWLWSVKLDGCRGFWDGKNFISRQGNVFAAPAWFKAGLPAHPLDGELWMGRQMFQKTMSIVRRQDAGELWKQVRYVVFDAPHLKTGFEDRLDFLAEWHRTASPAFASVHPHEKVRDKDHLRQLLREAEAAGDEGIMIRKPGSIYEACRSHSLLKVKPFKDAEAIVVGHEPGKGRHKGRLGGLVVRMPNGNTFNVGTGLSDDDRRSPPPVGSAITYSFTETTEAGIPKCAAFLRVRPPE